VWWKENKDKDPTLSISGGVQDSYLSCLARKVEWGLPDAILDMAHVNDPQVIPILRILTTVGDQAFTPSTISGRARFVLAQLGDEREFNKIVSGLDNGGYHNSMDDLRIIGGKRAVEALIRGFDSSNFLPEHQAYGKTYLKEVNERDIYLANVLAKMVAFPPETHFTADSAKKWRAWWDENKGTAQFIKAPVTSYE
jgi:hypothetical protein